MDVKDRSGAGPEYRSFGRMAAVGAVILFLVYYLYHLSFGIHLDELLFMDLGVSLVKGMKLVVENYSPYQFSELIQYPFMKTYYLLRGDFTGIVLFMRYVYAGIQLLLAAYIYFSLRSRSKSLAFVVSSMHFLYRYHWPTINYKALLYWGTILLSFSLYHYVRTDRTRYLALASAGIMIAAFGNPYAVILSIPTVIALLRLMERKKAWRAIVYAALFCVGTGLMLVLILAGIGGWDRFLQCLPYLFGDGTSQHKLTSAHRLTRLFIPIACLGLVENGVVFGIDRMAERKGRRLPWEKLLSGVFLLALLVICGARIRSAGPSRFWYVLLAVFLLVPFWYKKSECTDSEKKKVLHLFLLPACFMILVAILSTNQGIAVVAYGCVVGLFGIVMLNWKEPFGQKGGNMLGRLILAMLLFVAVFYVPEDGSANMLQKRIPVTEGPLRGIYAGEEISRMSRAVCAVVAKQVTAEDRLLIVADTEEALIGQAASAGSYGGKPGGIGRGRNTIDSGRNLLLYEVSPDRMPTVVIVDRKYMDGIPWMTETQFWQYIDSRYQEADGTNDQFLVMR